MEGISSICGGLDGKEKRWVVDCDDCENLDLYLSYVREAIGRCESKYDNTIVTTIPTRSGYHIITHPFNLQRFTEECKKWESLSLKLRKIILHFFMKIYQNKKM